jgi:hypothetical protein
MKSDAKEDTGIQRLLKKYRNVFRIPDNQKYYSERDYEAAERKFLQYALLARLNPPKHKERA